MTELNKHILDFNKAEIYTKNILKDANTLSNLIIKSINLEEGTFFTLLPNDANVKQINEFKFGGILVQNPRLKYDNHSSSTFSVTPTVSPEICIHVFKQILNFEQNCCIFDDVQCTTESKPDEFLISRDLQYIFEKELYYIVNKDNASIENIAYCLSASEALWHSLAVISQVDFVNHKEKKLSISDLNKICVKLKQFFVRAYDGEGYVFWESKV